jgi:hypothetical protein
VEEEEEEEERRQDKKEPKPLNRIWGGGKGQGRVLGVEGGMRQVGRGCWVCEAACASRASARPIITMGASAHILKRPLFIDFVQ